MDLASLRSHHGFPERLISIYDDFLSDRIAVVQVGESISEPFDQEGKSIWTSILQSVGK